MSGRRILILIAKELREFRSNPSAIVPVALLTLVCVAIPAAVLLVMPRITGQPVSSDRVLRQGLAIASRSVPELAALPVDRALEAFLFQQFLILFLFTPAIGAVSLAAYSVVGEKQGRTLEPLLTTPVTTAELLLAKVLASFLPSLAIEGIGLALYFTVIAGFASPGVLATVLMPRSLVLVGLIGPLAALTALQATIAVSSRVNDPRSAQQIAVLVVMPLMGMLVGEIMGAFFVTTTGLLLFAAVLAAAWILLLLFSVALFEREKILTKWD